jgi:uncharacterized protein
MKKLCHLIITSLLSLTLSWGLAIAPAQATGVYDLPIVKAGEPVWVIDGADEISFATEGKLDSMLGNLAQETGQEVRMVAIRRLDYGETIDSFIDDLFRSWFPTPEEQANQTIVVVDTLTNKTAIRTGETVQAILPPEIAQSIASETMIVPLKALKYNQALLDASERLIAVLSGNPDPGPPQIKEINIEGTYATAEETNDRSATIWLIVLLFLATLIPMVTYFWYVGFPGN